VDVMTMGIIITLVAVATFVVGVVAGIVLTVEHYGRVRAQQQADEERLAELQELYAAWAALRRNDQRPDM
jgi:MFS superfamily sulfate permease-like transporter